MSRPKSAKLRHRRFRLIHRKRMTDFGMCDDSPGVKTIWIKTDQPPQSFLDTLIHECLHGCFPDMSEEAVTETATSERARRSG